jgi:hypothetical protein
MHTSKFISLADLVTRLWGWTIEESGLVSERGQIFVSFFFHGIETVSGVIQPPVQ